MTKAMKQLAVLSLSVLLLAAGPASWAQDRAIEMVLGLAPGGAADASARLVAQHLEKILARSIVVVNRPGAGQVIAAGQLAKSAPDALMIGYLTNAIITSELSGLSKGAYQVSELKPACQINASGSVLVVRADLPVKTYQEFERYAKDHVVSAGHQGNGSANHMRLVMLSKHRGVPLSLVPYRGESDVLTNLLGRHVDAAAVSPTTALRNLDSGKFRVLLSWEELHADKFGVKLPLLKEIDVGIPDVGVKTYLWTRASAPRDFNDRLSAACDNLATSDAFRREFIGAGFDLVYRSGVQAREDIQVDLQRYRQILKDLDISAR